MFALLADVNIGNAAAIAGIALACSGALAARTYKSLADGYKAERDLERDKNDRLQGDVEKLQAQVDDLEEEVHELRLKDVSALFDLMKQMYSDMSDARESNQKVGQEILHGLGAVTRALEAIAVAVIPPPN